MTDEKGKPRAECRWCGAKLTTPEQIALGACDMHCERQYAIAVGDYDGDDDFLEFCLD